ncbi:hypothetical protein [Hymenobacter edaphi]|nr:hypothetical protein [Hymenobacter edaphi]
MYLMRSTVCGLLVGLGVGALSAPAVLAQTKVQAVTNPQERQPEQVWDFTKRTREASLPRIVAGVWVPDWATQPDSCVLLLHCRHSLSAPQPTPYKQTPFRFTASGATVTLDADNRFLFITPFADPVILRAYRGRKLVFTYRFRVFLLPPPTVVCTLSNADQRLEQLPLTDRTVSLKAQPNQMLAVFLPDDARYRVSQAEISLRRANEPVGAPIQVVVAPDQTTHADIGLGPLGAEARAGDELLIRVSKLQRKAANDEIEEVSFNQQYTIPLR